MLVEIALAMPIFLTFVFMFIWISKTQNESTALSSAVLEGTRLAVTRGKADNMGYNHLSSDGLIPELEENMSFSSEKVLNLLASEDQKNQAENTYNNWSTTFRRPFADLPPFYRYAIVYISQYMKRGVGQSVRFPCDPNDPNNDDPQEGKGCLKCRFINPDFLTGLESTSLNDPNIYSKYDGDPPEDFVAIICEFKPSGKLYQLIGNLINIASGKTSNWNNNIMTRSAIFRSPV